MDPSSPVDKLGTMLRRRFCLALALGAALPFAAPAQTVPKTQPKLVLTIVVDQFRYDYLTRFGSEFTGGLKHFWDRGAVFTEANYEAAPTVTAVGHSTVLSGATPSVSGIAGNTWWDREAGKNVQSITDDQAKPLGGGAGASPRRLLVSTIGDELKISGKGGKVFGVSLKDRAAILPAGRMADGAFWFDGRSGGFVSSDYYFAALPGWVTQFNGSHPADQFAGKTWVGGTMPAAGPQLAAAIDASPFGDDMVHEFALRLLAAERLGTGTQTDLLSVSYSSVDYVGHAKGPDSPEIHDMVRNVDRLIGELIDAAEGQAGVGNVLVVFTADHGVAPVPERNPKLPGGRIDARAERAAVEAALTARFGAGDYLAAGNDAGYTFKPARAGIDPAEMQRVAAEALRSQPHVVRVYTAAALANGFAPADRIDKRVRNGFYPGRSPDVVVLHDPFWEGGRPGGTTHGTPYTYDTHVPVVFYGSPGWIRPGHYYRDAGPHDIAPTLAAILGVALPSGANGRVLDEMLR